MTNRVLLAEDDKFDQVLFRKLLNQAGYDCEIVDTAAKLTKAVSSHEYDCIVADIRIPGAIETEVSEIIQTKVKCPVIRYSGVVDGLPGVMSKDRMDLVIKRVVEVLEK